MYTLQTINGIEPVTGLLMTFVVGIIGYFVSNKVLKIS